MTIAAPEGKDHTIAERQLEFLDIELTERCNLCCRHCYIRRPLANSQAMAREMNFEFISKLLQSAVSLGCEGVRLTGGEPLVRPDFLRIYKLATSLGLRVSLATNATLISDEIADAFAVRQPEMISISLYGWDADSYDSAVAVPGSFGKFCAGIDKLRRRGLAFKLKYPPTQFLVENSDKLSGFAKSLGFAGELPSAWELTMHARHDSAACRRIQACRMSPEQAAQQRLKEPEAEARDRQAIAKGHMRFTKKIFACRGAKKRLAIDPYGQLQVCLEVRQPETVYDLNRGSLQDAIAKHLPLCRQMSFTDPQYLERCGRCCLRPACPLCPACSWMENGDLQKVAEYHCQVMHAEARILGILRPEEKGWETSIVS